MCLRLAIKCGDDYGFFVFVDWANSLHWLWIASNRFFYWFLFELPVSKT